MAEGIPPTPKHIQHTDKVFVAGHNGLMGSALLANLRARGYRNLLTKTRAELNLLDQSAVEEFFKAHKPDIVVLAAAKVGGIHANNKYRADFIYENLSIQNNVIWNAHKHGTKRLVFLGSSCIYPSDLSRPLRENDLLAGRLEVTNRPYAVAKIAGLELVNSIRQQYGRQFFSVMPTNLYGPRDNFDLETSHVIPALIRKVYDAKRQGLPDVEVWGTGAPRREFMFVDDCADAVIHLLEHLDMSFFDDASYPAPGFSHINVGLGEDLTIADVAREIIKVFDYPGKIKFNTAMPDGTARKLLDTSMLTKLGWKAKYTLRDGLKTTRDWFESHKTQKQP